MDKVQESTRKLVVIESPYRGQGETVEEKAHNQIYNECYAVDCLRDSIWRDECPIASHLLYTQVLDDSDPAERTIGILLGLRWGKHADLIAVYEDRGISKGMAKAIKYWKGIGKEIEYRSLGV